MVGLCRLCASLRKMDVLVFIKDESNEICEKLHKCCQLNIKMKDALPKSICQECIENLNKSHKFYRKVIEAQETLQALYPTCSSQEVSSQDFESVQPSLVQTLSAATENSRRRNSSVLEPEQVKSSNDNEKQQQEKLEIPVKQIKLEKYLQVKSHNSCTESRNDKSITETKKSRENFIQEVYSMLDMTKEEEMLDTSYEVLETIEENNVENLTEEGTEKYFNYQELDEHEEHHVLEDIPTNNNIDVLNENELQTKEIDKTSDDIILPDKVFNIEFEYMDNCEDEEEDDDLVSNDQQIKQPPLQQFDTWKHYKYLCFICDNKFSNFIQLYRHFEQEHKKTQLDKLHYKCYDCQKVIPRYNFFLNHIRSKHHPDLKLRCEVCDLSCQTFEELAHHRSAECVDASNNALIVPCNQCFKSFHNSYGLQNHYKTQHTDTKGKLKYKCTECNKEFQYKSCLKVHEQVHTNKRIYSCSFCDSKFSNKKSLELHLYVHVDEKSYKCNICNKSFKTFLTLDQHQALHSMEKPFKCDFCDKDFRRKIQKIAHERTHTGEMPFTCEQCNKRFRFLSALNAHIKIHTGAKPYSCEYCDKTFADSSNRNKHVKRKHVTGKRGVNIKE